MKWKMIFGCDFVFRSLFNWLLSDGALWFTAAILLVLRLR